MITTKNILEKANDIVRDLLNNGWLITWGNSSYGYSFMVQVVKFDVKRRVYIERHYIGGTDELTLKVVDMKPGQSFEDEGCFPILELSWYQVTNNLYTDSKHESDQIISKRLNRSARYYEGKNKSIQLSPSKAFIKKIRNHHDFHCASAKNLTVIRLQHKYKIQMVMPSGKIRTRIIEFPNVCDSL